MTDRRNDLPIVKVVPIESITPYANNPRKISEDSIRAVAESIRKYGWQQPIVIDMKNEIIVGHTRYQAAQYLGLDQIPVHQTNLPAKEVKAYRIIDNKSNTKSLWDFDKLKIELTKVNLETEIFSLNFNPIELDQLMRIDHTPTAIPEYKAIREITPKEKAPRNKSIVLTPEQFDAFVVAISMLREFDPSITDGEGLSQICSEWARVQN